MSDALESDADVGLAAPPKGGAKTPAIESDADVGIGTPAGASVSSDVVPDTSVAAAGMTGLAHAIPFETDLAAGLATLGTQVPSWLRKAAGDTDPTDPNASWGQIYSQEKARINAQDAAVQEAHPYVSGAASLAGMAAALPVAGPIEGMANGISRFAPGLAGASVPLASGAVGAGLSALYGAGDQSAAGNDPTTNMGMNAAAGFVGGAAAPVVAEGLTKVAGNVGRFARGIFDPEGTGRSQALNQVAKDQASGLGVKVSPDAATAASEAGQPVMLADIGGQGTRDLAKRVANTSSDAQATLQDPMAARFANQNVRLPDMIDRMFGSDVNADQMAMQLKSLNKTVISPLYDKAMAEGEAGVWNPELQELTNTSPVQSAISKAEDLSRTDAVLKKTKPIINPFTTRADGSLALEDPKVTPTLQFWDVVKKSLDDQARRAGFGTYESSQISGLKNALTDILDDPDTGTPSYKQARQGAYEKFNAENALEAGQNILKTSATPQDYQQIVDKGVPLEQKALAYGAASAIKDKALATGDNRDIVNLFNTPAVRQKIAAAMGPDKANHLEAYFRVETAMNMGKNAVSGNSTTAKQTHDLLSAAWNQIGSPVGGSLAGVAAAYHEDGFDLPLMAKYGAAGFVAGALRKWHSSVNHQVAESIARTLASPDPKMRAAAVQRIARSKQLMDALRGTTNRLVAAPAAATGVLTPSQQQSLTPAYQ